MDKENKQCPFDSHTPEALVKEFSEMEDCTQELLSLFQTTPHSHLKRLLHVFLAVNNYNIQLLTEASHSSNRVVRYTATFVLLSKLKRILKSKTSYELADDIYNSVFAVRHRDVDPHIRAMAIQFLAEWACASILFRKPEHLKYLGSAMLDKSDLVKRRALRSIHRVVRIRSSKNKVHLEFLASCKENLFALASTCSSALIRREASILMYILFVKHDLISEEEVISVILNDPTDSAEKSKAVQELLPDNLHVLERIHFICEMAHRVTETPDLSTIFRSLDVNEFDVKEYMRSLLDFIKEYSACCGKPYLCYFDVLPSVSSVSKPDSFIQLLDLVKENGMNIQRLILALLNVRTFTENKEETIRLLYMLRDIAQQNPVFIDEYVKLLSLLSESFSHIVEDIVASLTTQYKLPLIKAFDVSGSLDDSSRSIEKCYGALWMIMRSNFDRLSQMKFTDTEEYLSLALFLEFCCCSLSKITGNSFNIVNITKCDEDKTICDTESALSYLATQLYTLIRNSFNFTDEDACLYLYKLINIGLFPDKTEVLYEHCSSDTITTLLSSTKFPKSFVIGYLKALSSNSKIEGLARLVASKVPKGDISMESNVDRYVFQGIKSCLGKKRLWDTALQYFVPYLAVEECIYIESAVSKSRLKTACLRRIRANAEKREESSILQP